MTEVHTTEVTAVLAEGNPEVLLEILKLRGFIGKHGGLAGAVTFEAMSSGNMKITQTIEEDKQGVEMSNRISIKGGWKMEWLMEVVVDEEVLGEAAFGCSSFSQIEARLPEIDRKGVMTVVMDLWLGKMAIIAEWDETKPGWREEEAGDREQNQGKQVALGSNTKEVEAKLRAGKGLVGQVQAQLWAGGNKDVFREAGWEISKEPKIGFQKVWRIEDTEVVPQDMDVLMEVLISKGARHTGRELDGIVGYDFQDGYVLVVQTVLEVLG